MVQCGGGRVTTAQTERRQENSLVENGIGCVALKSRVRREALTEEKLAEAMM